MNKVDFSKIAKKLNKSPEKPTQPNPMEELKQQIGNKKEESVVDQFLKRHFSEDVISEVKKEIVVEDKHEEKDDEQSKRIRSNIFDQLKKTPVKRSKEEGLPGVEYVDYSKHDVKFFKSLPRHELKHKDHSSIIIAKECLRKYFYKEVVNLVPNSEFIIFLPWGTAYHIYRQRLTELYGYGDNEPSKYDHEKAVDSHKKAARIAIDYWLKHGEEQKPDSKFDWFTAPRLYKSFTKAFEHWALERKQGKIKVLAVEQFFNIELKDGNFTQGRIDEAVLYNNELWGRDYKTTSKPEEWFEKSLRPNNQVRTYSFGNSKLAGREARGIIIQALYNGKSTKKGDKGPEIHEKLIETTKYELETWEHEQCTWNEIIELCRTNDTWPQSEVGCQWCPYVRVCVKGTEASMLYQLENNYRKKLRDPANPELSDD